MLFVFPWSVRTARLSFVVSVTTLNSGKVYGYHTDPFPSPRNVVPGTMSMYVGTHPVSFVIPSPPVTAAVSAFSLTTMTTVFST